MKKILIEESDGLKKNSNKRSRYYKKNIKNY